MTQLSSELHVHLCGCLSAEDVWLLGKDRWQKKTDLLAWYENEYYQAWGRRPCWNQYWNNGDLGFEQLKKDYLFKEKASFQCFQANFNLLIALFKITPEDTEILEHVITKHQQQGLDYVEYRTVLPHRFTASEADLYLKNHCQKILELEQKYGGQFTPRLAFTIMRDNEISLQQYQFLRAWLRQNPQYKETVTAIDFAYYEECHPPKNKKALFELINRDNKKFPDSPLAILYHVGESFQNMSIMSSCRWVWSAQFLGAHRLGHAIALGINPEELLGKTVYESTQERLDHLNWLLAEKAWLSKNGFDISTNECLKEISDLGRKSSSQLIQIEYTPNTIQEVRLLQDAIIKDLQKRGAIIESCPTSNMRIGQITDIHNHPLPRFVHNNLNVVVSTDDPGIFDIDLAHEVSLCHSDLKLTANDLDKIRNNSIDFRSEKIC